jgi:3-deoxy-D-manno-octulosonate 8-phosphate phosphatase (KDO 8-P phosphatase)
MTAEEIKEKALKIKLLIVDVDGVLTDGRIVHGNYGDELKFFDVQDGLGLALLSRAGFKTVVITAKKSPINHRRAKEIRITKLYQNVDDKLKVYEKLLRKFKLQHEEVCYVADDLVDLPVFTRVGLAVAVKNAVEEVKARAHYLTAKGGGRGAVREVTDMLLKHQNKWNEVTEKYFR